MRRDTTTETRARGRGSIMVWIGWLVGIAGAGRAGGVAPAVAWWILYWPALLSGALISSALRERRAASRVGGRAVGVPE